MVDTANVFSHLYIIWSERTDEKLVKDISLGGLDILHSANM